MTDFLRLISGFLILFLCWMSNADVYSLLPESGNSSNNTHRADLKTILQPSEIFSETIVANGVRLELKAGLIELAPDRIIDILKHLFPKAVLSAGKESMLVRIKLPNQRERRLLLICPGQDFPVIQFFLEIPEKLPRPQWPDALPLTADGVPVRTIYFPARKAWYGMFKTEASATGGLREIAQTLRASGWAAVSGEASGETGSSGEIFLRKDPLSIMLVNFTENGTAIVYTRQKKK